ncbi:hypothetical protein NBRC3188_3332 [Acetobacter pasteurianus NBRC 3188]|uniref:Uncharacterized protein n=1 Tax=Acetobacter pasteurianus NBRC 3188 TaxID=1226663 RepID=A0A401WZE0_ACEPA|nr:hypothetical protein NBRC3188_3332 [Acetobacter pasteurianus NBRC 3188]
MPQGMRPHTSGDRSSPRGIDNHAMELPCADGPHGVLPGKKPATRMHHALLASGLPPLPQQGQKVCRKHGVAISSPFAPFDPEQHALAVDITDLESGDLGHPQACPIGDRQGGLMLEAYGRVEQPGNFIAAQHDGQVAGLRYPYQLACKVGAVERLGEEKPQRRHDGIHGRCRHASLVLRNLELAHILDCCRMG